MICLAVKGSLLDAYSQLGTVLESTAGLYGDLQGIAGRAMQEIESLDVLMIDSVAAPGDLPGVVETTC